jgi:hypothetical protein
MADQFVRTTHQSYGNRITTSCKQMAAAPIFLIIGIWLLVWNEGNSISQHKALKEGLAVVVDLFENTNTIDPGLEGSLIHFTGQATTDSQITDPIFGVGPEHVLKLKRNVEMYQWVESKHTETTKNTGGSTDTTTTYTYTKAWKDTLQSGFEGEPEGHENPTSMLYVAQSFVADDIRVGAFPLSSEILSKIYWWQPLPDSLSTESILEQPNTSYVTISGNAFYFRTADEATTTTTTTTTPQIGDTRVSFQIIPSQVVSVVARQTGSGLSTYTASAGGSVLLVEAGYHDPAEMFKHANQALTVQTWLFRFLGWLLVFVAISSIMQPLSVCADVIPFVGDLVEVGNSCLSGFLASIVAIVTIAMAWLAYRPVFSAILFAISGGGVYWMKLKRHRRATRTNRQTTIPVVQAYELPAIHFKDGDNDDNLEEGGFSDHV